MCSINEDSSLTFDSSTTWFTSLKILIQHPINRSLQFYEDKRLLLTHLIILSPIVFSLITSNIDVVSM